MSIKALSQSLGVSYAGKKLGEKETKDLDQGFASPDGTADDVPDKIPAVLDHDAGTNDTVGKDQASEEKKRKRKKAVKNGSRVPKVKKRSPRLVDGSEVAYLEIDRNYYEEQEAPDFKCLMDDLETAISEALGCVFGCSCPGTLFCGGGGVGRPTLSH